MPQRRQLACPMMRRGAGLHTDEARLDALEQCNQPTTADLPAQHRAAFAVDAVNLKDVLRNIQTDSTNLHGPGSSSAAGPMTAPPWHGTTPLGWEPSTPSNCWLGWRPAGMARAYSEDLRERVVAAVGDGQSCRRVAVVFRVSVASVVKWSQRARETGSAAARPQGGRPGRSKLDGERSWLLARLAEKPDLTLKALVGELRQRGVVVALDTLWRFLRAAGI